ncbi:MAG: iron-sulfur cluster repair di-iron protein [Bacteroidetes bacterium]|jgi:regulator of cell morphogenesis and NO signaling|nr:iron-sulfur cluster repair di-iron protein [Bacteroidota bacterium]
MKQTESLATRRIGDIVGENYRAAGVFSEYGIDFCCGGGIQLKKACEKKGLSTDELVRQLESALQQETETDHHNYSDWDAGFLIDYIINTHHTFVRRKVDEIGAYAAKVARVHGERYPENIDIAKAFASLSEEMLQHLESEEETVFPLIKRLVQKRKENEAFTDQERNELKKQLRLMEEEHEGAGSLMAKIRKFSNDYTPPADACRTYQILYQNLEGFEKDLHKHVHLENNILFKKAQNLL